MYNSSDMKLLRTLANQSAIAVENAFAYKLVEDYAKKLEEANKELRETQAQLIQSEKMSAVGQLAAGIAHEIRNPLNIIEGARYCLSQMISGENSRSIGEYLDYIKNEIDRTNRLIDNLLKFSKAEPSHFELVDVNNILEDTLVLLRKQLSDSNIRLITNFNYQIPKIMGDLNQLWQVFINIVINAVQAMPQGGELRIDTGLYYGSRDHIFISFKDTGIGIDEKDLPKIFNPFFTTKNAGTGLGLSISYKIVEEHKGRIIVSSEKGRGSIFILELPVSYSSKGGEDDREQKSLSS
jgi:signal transduction histidine kinase